MTLRVGITGGIGSGKSTVCGIVETLGYPVYNADIEARKISDTDSCVIAAISNLFGEYIYLQGLLDRKRLASIVFSNGVLLRKLNEIVHPAVAKHYESWVENHGNYPVVFYESAILLESGSFKCVDKIIAVVAPLETKISRVIKRDNTDRNSIIERINNQFPDKELISRSDFVIMNNDNNLLLPQIIKIVGLLMKESS